MSVAEMPMSARDRALYGKLQVSLYDLAIARRAAAILKKKGWHKPSFFRRGSTEIQQIAFTTTMIVAYSRPFKPGKATGSGFPEKLIRPYSSPAKEMHARLLALRDKVHAHMDPESYNIRVLDDPFIRSIDQLPDTYFSAEEIDLFMSMTDELIRRIRERMDQIHRSISTPIPIEPTSGRS